MIRLHLIVEGQTEETFVNQVLGPELAEFQVVVDAQCITTSRNRSRVFRGGFVSYQHLKNDISRRVREDQREDARFSTMVDLFRLPRDFPGIADADQVGDPVRRAEQLERNLADEIKDRRFLPYLQVHQFESLLFADPSKFESAVPFQSLQDARLAMEDLLRVRSRFPTPEHINRETPPGKRIAAAVPQFDKVAHGVVVARQIGLRQMEASCPHFAGWLRRLRRLDGPIA